LRLSDPERATLAEIGKRLGRKGLGAVACVAKPDTILAWYRRLVAKKFDGSKHRRYPGRPRVAADVEALVVRMARENADWGYDRIVGALSNLGHKVSDQTVGNILRRHGIAPAPKRGQTTTWKDFIAAHMNVLAGADFFTVEVLTWRGLATYYVLFFLHLESRRVRVAGITRHPNQEWMEQIARSAVGAGEKSCDHHMIFLEGSFLGIRDYLKIFDGMRVAFPILELLLHEVTRGFSTMRANVQKIIGKMCTELV